MPTNESQPIDQDTILLARIADARARFLAGTKDGLWPEEDDTEDADDLYPRS